MSTQYNHKISIGKWYREANLEQFRRKKWRTPRVSSMVFRVRIHIYWRLKDIALLMQNPACLPMLEAAWSTPLNNARVSWYTPETDVFKTLGLWCYYCNYEIEVFMVSLTDFMTRSIYPIVPSSYFKYCLQLRISYLRTTVPCYILPIYTYVWVYINM